jgi:1-acyl-sn-glycerol-3-phosphate acyltransferase
MNLVRSVVFAAWLYTTMSIVGLAYAPFTILDRKYGFSAGRVWTRWTLFGLRWIVGARVKIEGDLPDGPALVAGKHQSMLDTMLPFLMTKSPAFVLKRELLSYPLFGWYAVKLGMIPIDRDGGASTIKAMLKAARVAIAEGRPVIIFPEGTRQDLGVKAEYKSGVAALYRDLALPCIPVALDTGRIWSAHGLIRRPGHATLRVLAPIPPGLPREAFMRQLETAIETESAALAARP